MSSILILIQHLIIDYFYGLGLVLGFVDKAVDKTDKNLCYF